MEETITQGIETPEKYPTWKSRTLAKLKICNGLTVERLQTFLWGKTTGETGKHSYTDKQIQITSKCYRFLHWMVEQGDIEIQYTRSCLTTKAKVWAKGTQIQKVKLPEAPRPGFEVKVYHDPNEVTQQLVATTQRQINNAPVSSRKAPERFKGVSIT